MQETPPIALRGGLRRLSAGLIAYGLIGLVVAAIAFGALVWVNGRVGSLRSEVETTIAQIATTTDRTSTALSDASTTAETFTRRSARRRMPSRRSRNKSRPSMAT